MKKILIILGAIGLTVTSTTTLISCEKPNNNENEGDNKPKPTRELQKPPKDSNWKLVSDYENEFKIPNNKWYIFVTKSRIGNWWNMFKSKNNGIDIKYSSFGDIQLGTTILDMLHTYIYCWNNENEPEKPDYNAKTGQITEWKG